MHRVEMGSGVLADKFRIDRYSISKILLMKLSSEYIIKMPAMETHESNLKCLIMYISSEIIFVCYQFF